MKSNTDHTRFSNNVLKFRDHKIMNIKVSINIFQKNDNFLINEVPK